LLAGSGGIGSAEGGGPIKVEFAMALKKIYGQAEPEPNFVEAEVKPMEPEKGMAGVGASTD